MDYVKNNNQLVLWLAGILLAIIAVLGGFFLYYKLILSIGNESEEEISVNSTSSEAYQIPMGVTVPDETGSQTQDPTTDWLSFLVPDLSAKKSTTTGTSTLFSFRYPKDLNPVQNGNNVILTSASVTSSRVMVSWSTTTKGLKEYIKEVDAVSAKAWEGKPSIKVVTSTDKATFGSLPAVIREQKLLAADLSEYIIYFKSSSTVYSVGVIAPQLNQNLFNFLAVFVNTFKLGN